MTAQLSRIVYRIGSPENDDHHFTDQKDHADIAKNNGYEVAEYVLAGMDREPVAYLYSASFERGHVEGELTDSPGCDMPVYSAPPATVAVPDEAAVGEMSFLGSGEASYVRGWNDCRAAMLKAGPVTGWIKCSERMPEDDDFVYVWPRPDLGVELHVGQYCECHPKGDGWYAQVYEQHYGIEWHQITVTHWMPLPSAPEQEV